MTTEEFALLLYRLEIETAQEDVLDAAIAEIAVVQSPLRGCARTMSWILLQQADNLLHAPQLREHIVSIEDALHEFGDGCAKLHGLLFPVDT
jgi:hypothetical protein